MGMRTARTGLPSVSVVVSALNEEGHVGQLLEDIERQSRRPQEEILVDAGSEDDTVAVVERFAGVRVLRGGRPVARGRNLGGRSASGEVIVFLDARLPGTFLERFVEDFTRRRLDVACPLYAPYDSTPAVERFHGVFNLATRAFRDVLPSGAGICMAVRGDLFRRSRGFDPRLKFDHIELIRCLASGRRFGIVEEKVFVSDRRYREHGVARHPRVLAHGAVLRPRQVRVGEPHEVRVRQPRLMHLSDHFEPNVSHIAYELGTRG